MGSKFNVLLLLTYASRIGNRQLKKPIPDGLYDTDNQNPCLTEEYAYNYAVERSNVYDLSIWDSLTRN